MCRFWAFEAVGRGVSGGSVRCSAPTPEPVFSSGDKDSERRAQKKQTCLIFYAEPPPEPLVHTSGTDRPVECIRICPPGPAGPLPIRRPVSGENRSGGAHANMPARSCRSCRSRRSAIRFPKKTSRWGACEYARPVLPVLSVRRPVSGENRPGGEEGGKRNHPHLGSHPQELSIQDPRVRADPQVRIRGRASGPIAGSPSDPQQCGVISRTREYPCCGE